jgi:hypothetical protein
VCRDKGRKTHRQADCGAIVLVKTLNAAEAGMFADQFQHGDFLLVRMG